jgi:hypothetical protein
MIFGLAIHYGMSSAYRRFTQPFRAMRRLRSKDHLVGVQLHRSYSLGAIQSM